MVFGDFSIRRFSLRAGGKLRFIVSIEEPQMIAKIFAHLEPSPVCPL
jgi:hypothetical protein